MSDYDFHRQDTPKGRAMDYGSDRSGSGLWAGIGVVAVLALIAIIMVAGSGGTPDGTAPGVEATGTTGAEVPPPTGSATQ